MLIQGSFKNVSMKFCFTILLLHLIAATRAEGALVYTNLTDFLFIGALNLMGMQWNPMVVITYLTKLKS